VALRRRRWWERRRLYANLNLEDCSMVWWWWRLL
jgi:hypothetical protein